MIETKIVEIRNDNVQSMINEMQYYGWQVLSSQKIDYTTTSKISGSIDEKSNIKLNAQNKNTCYYSITFQRDTNMPYYDKLNELYNEYQTELLKYRKSLPEKPFSIAKIIYQIMSIFMFIFSFIFTIRVIVEAFQINKDNLSSFISVLVWFIIFLSLSIMFSCLQAARSRQLNKLQKEYKLKVKEIRDEMNKNINTIHEKAKLLLKNENA